MTAEEFFNDPVDVIVSISREGAVKPSTMRWQGQDYTISDVGRQWVDEVGRHVLVETGQGDRFELLLARQDLIWYIKRAWRVQLAA